MQDTLEISNMKDFNKLASIEAKELKSVTFCGMEINEEFVEKFWNVFTDSVVIKKLNFDRCSCANGFHYADLIASGTPSESLKITNCGLSVEEASDILLQANPYTLRYVDFSGNKFKKSDFDFQEMLKDRVIDRLCLDQADLCVN